MALKIRRGSDTVRQTITPVEGELLYTSDTKKIFVGDGSTLGGIQVSGVNEGIANAIAYYEQDGKEVSTTSNLKWNDVSNILFVDKGSMLISNESSARSMMTISQNYSSATGSNFVFARSRGSVNNPTLCNLNDSAGNISFNTFANGATSYTTSSGITSFVSVAPTAGGSNFDIEYVSKTGSGLGPYYVTYNFVTQGTAPVISRSINVAGNSNPAYNGSFRVFASTTSSMTLYFNTDPGEFGTGTTTASRESITPGSLGLLTQTTNGNLTRTVKIGHDGLVVIGPLLSDFLGRPYDPSLNGQLAINATQTNVGQTSALAQLTLRTYADTSYSQSINLYRFRGTVVSPAAVQSGDQIYYFKFGGSDGPTGAGIAAGISVTVDNTVSTGKVPGAITFSTGNASSGALVNAVKIDSTQQTTFYGNVKHSALDIISPNYITVSSSIPYSLSATQTTNILLVTADTYTATLNMPANPVDGQVCVISISGYSVNLQSGTGTVLPSFAGSSKQPGTVFKYVYRTSNTTWYQIG